MMMRWLRMARRPHMAEFNKAIGAAKISAVSVKAYEISNVRTLIGE